MKRKHRRPSPNRVSFGMEIVRKLIHVTAGILIVLFVEKGILTEEILGLIIFIFGLVVLLNYKYEQELLTHVLSINRADARIPGLDVLSFFLGAWLVLIIFPNPLAFAAIMILAFADPAAHLLGTGFGGTDVSLSQRQIWSAAATATLIGALAAWVYVDFWPALIASAVAMFIEAGEFKIRSHHIDDNLTIPLVAGAVLWLITLI
ncbi:hypothetical protein GOV11_05155 [Candidatus Woesearchaeota archaeon]|nr:hypothetical protein [Candidatus Woesearchaeota archaeon]